jgi:hypothetical protein
MGRSRSTPKSKLIVTRVTPRIRRIIESVALSEGLYTSEWVRKVIVKELKNSKLLTPIIEHPIVEETDYPETKY